MERLLGIALAALFGLAHAYGLVRQLPLVFGSSPATGGDLGSHLWPVVALREYGIPNLDLRVWNPGNYLGEPLLVHYFPLPFLLMALASYFMPIGLAFNLGTFLPIIALPLCVYWGCARLTPALGATASQARIHAALAGLFAIGVMYNAGNTMWGGNALSNLAGQFAHQYAFCFFFLLMGLLPSALTDGRRFALAALTFAAVVTSHAYVALFLPALFLGAWWFLLPGSPFLRLRRLVTVGAVGTMLSVWFWWPLIDNTKWTTPYAFKWSFPKGFQEVCDSAQAPALVVAATTFVLACFMPRLLARSWRGLAFWAVLATAGFLGYLLFDRVGLVDVRAVPVVQFAVAATAAWMLTVLTRDEARGVRTAALVAAVAMPFVQVAVSSEQRELVTDWVRWNYSGWTTKPGAESLRALSRELAGSFDDPRVVFEHAAASNAAGTERVFEMLPYFAGRATTDGLYMQSTILAPMTFYHQATVSAEPSCPYDGYGCSSIDLPKALRLAKLFAVDTLILATPRMFEVADASPDLALAMDAAPWRAYKIAGLRPSYVDVPAAFERIDPLGWRQRFWKWFESYQESDPVLIVASPDDVPNASAFLETGACEASTHAEFGAVTLRTNCPGRFHVLKYAFHDSFRAETGERIWLASPGFIGVVPGSSVVTLRFGQAVSWRIASWISLLALGALAALAACRWFGVRFPEGVAAAWARRSPGIPGPLVRPDGSARRGAD